MDPANDLTTATLGQHQLVGDWLRPIATGASRDVSAGVRRFDDRQVMWLETSTHSRLTRADFDVLARACDEAAENGLPIVGAIADLTPEIGTDPGSIVGWGHWARSLAAASGVVPTVVVIDGPVTSGLALVLGLVDIVIATDRSMAYVSGPPAVAATSGRTIDPIDLGGPSVHGSTSGVVSIRATDSDAALAAAADLLAFLPSNNLVEAPRHPSWDSPERRSTACADLVPSEDRLAYDVRDVIADLVDDQEMYELRADFGRSIVCGLARLDGHSIGVVASQPAHLAGAIDIATAQKAARFVQWCDAFGLPLLTLVDTPGFLPGRDLEWDGMIRHGGQLAFAYAAATVPRLCVIMRKAFGGAYIVMDCATMGNDVAFAWPGSKIAVMGAPGAVQILHQRRLSSIEPAAAIDERERLEAEYTATHLTPDDALRRGYIDAIIDPAETRPALCRALATLLGKRSVPSERKHHNGPL